MGTAVAGLALFDPLSLVLLGAVCLTIARVLPALVRRGFQSIVPIWLGGLLLRFACSVIEVGNEWIIPSKDGRLYEQSGELLGRFPIEDMTNHFGRASTGTRGIIFTHGLFEKFDPIFRTGVYVAFLSSLLVSIAVALAILASFDYLSVASRRTFAVLLNLSPPFAFWGSQNTKEGFITLGVTVFVFATLRSSKKLLALGLALCFVYRPYIGLLVPSASLVAYFYVKVLARRERTRSVLLGTTFILLLAVGIQNGSLFVGKDLDQYSAGVTRSGGRTLDTGIFGLGPQSPLIVAVKTVFNPPPWFIPVGIVDLVSIAEGFLVGVILALVIKKIFGPAGVRTFPVLSTFFIVFFILTIYGLGLNIGTNIRLRSVVLPAVGILYAICEKRERSPQPGARLSTDSYELRATAS
jgi:hypothetical protein